jgi:hypothetical protein
MRSTIPGLLAITLGAAGWASAQAAPGLEAYVLSAGGNSILGANGNPFGCATFAPDSRAAVYAGYFGVGLPTDGSICGVGVDARSSVATTGSSQVAATLGVGFGTSTDVRTFNGSAQARAGYGALGVAASGSYTGASDGFTVAGSQAGARQVETLTFGGAVGTGTFRPTFTIDGAIFNRGRTETEIEFNYGYASDPNRLTFRIINSNNAGISFFANGGYQSSLPGMTTTGDGVNGYTVAGSTTFSFDIPIVFGQSQEVRFSMWAATLPRSNLNLLTPSTGDASFFSSARLTGIQAFDSAGVAVNAFSVVSGSGTLYGPGGVLPVPEPGPAVLLLAGLLALRWRCVTQQTSLARIAQS